MQMLNILIMINLFYKILIMSSQLKKWKKVINRSQLVVSCNIKVKVSCFSSGFSSSSFHPLCSFSFVFDLRRLIPRAAFRVDAIPF